MSNLGNSVVKKLEQERRSATNKLANILSKQQELRNKQRVLETQILETNNKIINYNKNI